MDQIVYLVQLEGIDWVLYREVRYDTGNNRRLFIREYLNEGEAREECERLNRESDNGS